MTQKISIHVDSKRLQRAAEVAEDAVRNGPYPSAVITVANAEATILTHTVSHPGRAPAREDSIFLLASIAKPIVATASMRLLVEQRRRLDRVRIGCCATAARAAISCFRRRRVLKVL